MYTKEEIESDYEVKVKSLDFYQLEDVQKQSKDPFCQYADLDLAWNFAEHFENSFLDRNSIIGYKEGWLLAAEIHSKLFDLYQLLGNRLDNEKERSTHENI